MLCVALVGMIFEFLCLLSEIFLWFCPTICVEWLKVINVLDKKMWSVLAKSNENELFFPAAARPPSQADGWYWSVSEVILPGHHVCNYSASAGYQHQAVLNTFPPPRDQRWSRHRTCQPQRPSIHPEVEAVWVLQQPWLWPLDFQQSQDPELWVRDALGPPDLRPQQWSPAMSCSSCPDTPGQSTPVSSSCDPGPDWLRRRICWWWSHWGPGHGQETVCRSRSAQVPGPRCWAGQ